MEHYLVRLFASTARDPVDGGTLLHFVVALSARALDEHGVGGAISNTRGLGDLILRLVRDVGVDPEATNQRGETVLLVAVKMGRTDLAEILLGPAVGASGAARDHAGRGVFHWATIFSTGEGDMAMHSLLLGHAATRGRINDADEQGITPLHLAALGGMRDVAQALVAHGARINVPCAYGRTALMETRCPATVRLLLRAGAELPAADRQGSTAAHWAAFRDAADALAELCRHADQHMGDGPVSRSGCRLIELRDAGGLTPLMEAARYGRRAAVSVLLSFGARVDDGVRDHAGRTVLHHAARFEGPLAGVLFVDLLLAGRCTLDAKDAQGHTPLEMAGDDILEAVTEVVIFDRGMALGALRDIAGSLDGNEDVANVALDHLFVAAHPDLVADARAG